MRRSLSLSILALSLFFGAQVLADDPIHEHDHDHDGHGHVGVVDPAEPLSAKQQVKILLSAHCSFPSKTELLAVTPEVVEVLIELYDDPTSIPSIRTRALDALGYFQSDATPAFFERVLAREDTPSRELHHAITAYNKAYGELALPTTVVFLNHSDVQLRLTAVEALQRQGSMQAQAVLAERQAIEADPVVSEKLRRITPVQPLQ